MFKRKKKSDERTKRLLDQELEVTTYDKEERLTDLEDTKTESPVSTEPDNGYPEIGPSYQMKEDTEPIEEPTMEEDTSKEQLDKEDLIQDSSTLHEDKEPTIDAIQDNHEPKEEVLQSVEDDPMIEEETSTTGWQWTDVDNDELQENMEEEPLQAPDFILEDIPDEEASSMMQEFTLPTKDKVDLNEFFEASKEQKKLKRRDKKQYSRKELKRRKKRQTRSRVPDDIRDQKVFLFRKKRYKTVEDFIKYLNDHYLDIDDVASEVLADENFFGFVGKKSGVFPQSLQEFREIKKKIEGNE